MKKKTIPIRGMHCASCEVLIGKALEKVPQVTSASVDHRKGRAEISYLNDVSDSAIAEAIEESGYTVGETEATTWFSRNVKEYTNVLAAIVVVYLLYILFRSTDLASLDMAQDAESSLFVVLLVGLVAGLSTCMALIGGLILGLSARHAELHPEATRMQKFRPHLFFNLGRIGGYALFGGFIGLIGNAFELSPILLGTLTVIVGAVMIFLGLKLIDIFPVLKNKTFSLPASIAKKFGIKKEQKEYSHKAAIVAGSLTFFLPCGFTQSMQLYAMTTGSFGKGALIMGLFALGTAPGLLGIGGLSSFLKGAKAKLLFAVAGIIVLLLGWYNIQVGSRLLQIEQVEDAASMSNSLNVVEPKIIKAEYSSANDLQPNEFTVTSGKPVQFDIFAKDSGRGCAAYIVIPGLSNKQQLLKGGNTIQFAFTPKKPGRYAITCGMGMITWGYITVQ